MSNQTEAVNLQLSFGKAVDYSGFSERDIYKAVFDSCLPWEPEKLRRFNLWPYGLATDWLVYEQPHPGNPALLSYTVRQLEDYESIACTCSYFKALNEKGYPDWFSRLAALSSPKICQHVAEVLIRVKRYGLQDGTFAKIR